MNRWWGSSDDSAKQSAARDQRAASRFIRQLPPAALSDPEEEFAECNTSFHNSSLFNLDGQEDVEDSSDEEQPGRASSVGGASFFSFAS